MGNRLGLAAILALALAAEARAEETAEYRLDLDITWGTSADPGGIPPSAHLSRLIGATHHRHYVMFADGMTASSGLQSLAERGRIALLTAELEEARDRERVGAIFEAGMLGSLPGRASTGFSVTETHSLVSFVTMVAPSPDWFTGGASIPLFEDGEWVEKRELTLWAWDAGTDGGTTFLAEDVDTQPRESVRLIANAHFLGSGELMPIGKATLVRTR